MSSLFFIEKNIFCDRMSKELWLKKPGGKMFKDLLLKDGINYISKDDLEKEAKSRSKIKKQN